MIVMAKFISIHASHAGRDNFNLMFSTLQCISIHAAHAGRDMVGTTVPHQTVGISIHASHAGRDDEQYAYRYIYD